MFSIRYYLKSRPFRSASFLRLGPNEARLLYDFVAGYSASVVVMVLFIFLFKKSFDWAFIIAPIILLAVNTILGIYSKHRMSKWRIKVAMLIVSVVATCFVLFFLGVEFSQIVLWGVLVSSPLILARFLLALPHSKHKNVAMLTVRHQGTVLVTGGAGYIGSCIVDLLLRNGYSVKVLDRLMYGVGPVSDFCKDKNFELIQGDVTDISKLTYAMKDAWMVVHLAGLVGDAACSIDDALTRQMNIISTRMLKEVAQSMGVHRFVFASSCSVYGMSDKAYNKETDTLNPVSLYAQTKIDSENELLSSSRDDFFVTILRFSTVFGHARRPRFDLVGNLFTAQAIKNRAITVIGPNQLRPFIHVTDIARAVLATLRSNPVLIQNQIFNVGDDRFNMTILQLAEKVKSIVESHGGVVDISIHDQVGGDMRNYSVSFEKIKNIFKFQSEKTIELGIQEIAENFRNNVYSDYHEEIYNNFAMTKKIVTEFYDPMQSIKMYAPLQSVTK